MAARFYRLAETGRKVVNLTLNGQPVAALEGDTLMVALLSAHDHLRRSEFGDGTRAGFCLMGACQDCWVWTQGGERLRACSTAVSNGLNIRTSPPEVSWSDVL